MGFDRLRALVFQSLSPLEQPATGTPADLTTLRLEAVQSFYETHYTASNAILIVTGAIEPEATSQLVYRFFETVRRQERPMPPPLLLAEQSSQRVASLEAAQFRAPVLLYGWATPGGRTDDALAVEAALHVLASNCWGGTDSTPAPGASRASSPIDSPSY
ncbi:MAG: insulinase family protein [Myxococcales bacterium]|nr:insulinase family protein [Polyangiaceae bacterium]MDW8249058.1 insulinase family protein [Myxococcales bacterium]